MLSLGKVGRTLQKGSLRLAGAILLVYLAGAGNASGQQPGRTKTLVGSVFDGLVRPGDPGLAVLIRQGGKNSFRESYGVRDLRLKAKIDAHTNFRLASFTKQFTAMAIMLLVRNGKLRYDETLTEVFPDFPAYGKTITIRNLLNHASGLLDYEDLMQDVFPYKHDTPDFAGALPPD